MVVVGGVHGRVVELVEQLQQGFEKGLVAEEGVCLARFQKRLVQDELLVPKLVRMMTVNLEEKRKVFT